MNKPEPAICKHPPDRYFSGTYIHPEYGTVLWIGCCDCGELLGEKHLDRKQRKSKEVLTYVKYRTS